MTRTKHVRLSVLLLTALLLSCGPDTQQGPTTALSQEERNVQDSGAVTPTAPSGEGDPRIAAAKRKQPHQYRERPPLSLFDVGTNLNPASNR